MSTSSPKITVEVSVNAPVEKVWKMWNAPEDITQWAVGSPEWHTPSAQNDLRVGGKFLTRMEAKDGSIGFDFTGTYDVVERHRTIAYTMEDGRKVSITFTAHGATTTVTETFDPESENTPELQREGWQGILNNFKMHVESKR